MLARNDKSNYGVNRDSVELMEEYGQGRGWNFKHKNQRAHEKILRRCDSRACFESNYTKRGIDFLEA